MMNVPGVGKAGRQGLCPYLSGRDLLAYLDDPIVTYERGTEAN